MALNIGVIIGSTRPGRNGSTVARWFKEVTDTHEALNFTWIDLEKEALPFYDEPIPPKAGKYQNAHTKDWAEKIDALDGFIIITNEYNHAPSASVKNALDFVYKPQTDRFRRLRKSGRRQGDRAPEADRGRATNGTRQPKRHAADFQHVQRKGRAGHPRRREGPGYSNARRT